MRKMLFLMAAALPGLLVGCSGKGTGHSQGASNAAALKMAGTASPQANGADAGRNSVAPNALPAGGQAILVDLKRMGNIPATPNDPVNVSDVKFATGVGGHFITAKVSYGGGCRDHEFKAYWSGAWDKSDPPGINIVLRHNANGDTCRALLTRLVQINIAEPAAENREFWVELFGPNGSVGRADVKVP